MSQPSIDCLLMRARQMYGARIVRSRPRALLAFLNVSVRERRLPWVAQLFRGTEQLRLSVLPEGFPSMDEAPLPWTEMMVCGSVWHLQVNKLIFPESACDTSRSQVALVDRGLAFTCDSSAALFATSKA